MLQELLHCTLQDLLGFSGLLCSSRHCLVLLIEPYSLAPKITRLDDPLGVRHDRTVQPSLGLIEP